MRKTSGGICIRPIARAALSDVAGIERQGQTAPWSDDSLVTELTDANAFHFGVYSGREQRLLAFVLARTILDELHIHRICTHPDFRRAGYALTLLGHLLDAALSRGAHRAFLEVAASNTAAQALYRRMGFTEDSMREHYYSTGDDAITMSKSLVAQESPKGTAR
jgi:ribosomal-protein-alanine N-acetyltransferase